MHPDYTLRTADALAALGVSIPTLRAIAREAGVEPISDHRAHGRPNYWRPADLEKMQEVRDRRLKRGRRADLERQEGRRHG